MGNKSSKSKDQQKLKKNKDTTSTNNNNLDKKVIILKDEFKSSSLVKANSLFNSRQYTEALTFYIETINKNETSFCILREKADILYESDQHEEALAYYQMSLEFNKNDYDHEICRIGRIYHRTCKHIEAVESFKENINIPSDVKYLYYNEIGISFVRLELYDKAETLFKKMLEIDDKKETAYSNLGYVYYQMQDYRSGLEYFKKALEIKPNDQRLHINIRIATETIENMRNREEIFMQNMIRAKKLWKPINNKIDKISCM